ncbi:MAG TPA: pilin [bacterium]|nr:pilin [bacterium]
MRFFKFVGSALALVVLLFPQLSLATEMTCVKSKSCVEVSASCKRIVSYIKSTENTTINSDSGNGGTNVSSVDLQNLNEVDLAVLDSATVDMKDLMLFVCQFDDIGKISGANDSDKKAVCVKYKNVEGFGSGELSKVLDIQGSFYKCVFGDKITTRKPVSELYICPTGTKCVNNWAAAKTDTTIASTSSAFGSGNVTCGNRTFSCSRGGWFSGVSDQCYCCGSCTPDDLLTVGNTVLKWLFSIIGAVGLAMFVWGGFKFITSAGSGSEVTAGKKAMINAVIGLVIMFSAGAVVTWIQEKLELNKEVRINISNAGPTYSTTTGGSGTSTTEVHGSTKIGESCLYNQSTKSSYCAEGLYCYSIDQTKGVCLPQNPEKSVSPGGDCYVLPGDGSKDMCKTGTCQAADKTAGTKGTCPTVEDNPSVTIGDTCKTDAECAGKNLFTVSSTCYKKSGSATGKCLPSSGRNVDAGGSCYVLPGTGTNDCAGSLLCVQNPDASDPKLNRTIGELGVCYNYKNQTRGYACSKSFECSSADSCLSVPKASNRSYCLKTGTTFNDTEDQACELIELSDGTTDVDSCVSGLTCMEVDGSMKCAR